MGLSGTRHPRALFCLILSPLARKLTGAKHKTVIQSLCAHFVWISPRILPFLHSSCSSHLAWSLWDHPARQTWFVHTLFKFSPWFQRSWCCLHCSFHCSLTRCLKCWKQFLILWRVKQRHIISACPKIIRCKQKLAIGNPTRAAEWLHRLGSSNEYHQVTGGH